MTHWLCVQKVLEEYVWKDARRKMASYGEEEMCGWQLKFFFVEWG